jgi:uncharacterized membrane protein
MTTYGWVSLVVLIVLLVALGLVLFADNMSPKRMIKHGA